MPDDAGSAAEQCLGLVAYGVHQGELGDTTRAKQALLGALLAAQRLPQIPGQGEPLRALVLYHLSRLKHRSGPEHAAQARQMRDQADGLLAPDHGCAQLPPPLMPLFQELMATILANLGEHRRAIPYCEAALQNIGDSESPAATAWPLWRAGKAYLNVGLRDHAAIPLRAAVKVYRILAGDPRLAAVLIDLGAALSRSAPAEAERCYEEAAQIHMSKAQLESTTTAWMNLGVICAKQGRYAEALVYYEKVLHIRENTPGIPAARIGIVHNNTANVHRHMKNFDEAFRSIDRALALLEPSGGHFLACAYGTRGLILRDQGRDEESIEWFRKSSAEHRKQASPNLDTLSEELENEAAALDRLGRIKEAASARAEVDSVRAALSTYSAPSAAPEPAMGAEGAVLIELDFGSRAAQSGRNFDTQHLKRRLSAVASEQNGRLGGCVVIPETTTFLFYGTDAEALFRSLHPALLEEPACNGARVTIRQGASHREVILPRPVM